MPTINVALLKKTLSFIKKNPKTWDQSTWQNQCGTTCCFAGHAVLLSGGEIKAPPAHVKAYVDSIKYRLTQVISALPEGAGYARRNANTLLTPEEIAAVAQARVDATTNMCKTPTGRFTEIATFARKALGLSAAQASDLFRDTNDLSDLEEKVAALVKLGKAQAARIEVEQDF